MGAMELSFDGGAADGVTCARVAGEGSRKEGDSRSDGPDWEWKTLWGAVSIFPQGGDGGWEAGCLRLSEVGSAGSVVVFAGGVIGGA